MAKLNKAWQLVALKLQEQATDLSHSDICKRLSDALRELAPPGEWYYLMDVFGDDQSGDVVYCCNGDTMKAPYTISDVNGKQVCAIDIEQAIDVVPRTIYEEEADDEDHYAAMGEAKLYTEAPLYERFISKDERTAADTGSFAGKGKSFPILKPGDVMAAVRSMGRAGSDNYDTATLKSRIISIAKKKGWSKYLPKGWQDKASEAAEIEPLELGGEFIPLREGAVGQDGTAYLKLIQPGWGSSGYYSPQLLERDGPKVFKAGTKNFWNHQTEAEESARPEGDLRDLASVLTEDARYEKKGPAGPGLYAKAKVFEQFRQPVDDLAKHIGMSIRANGRAKEGKAEGRTGKIIEELTQGISVDYVTTPGAGGQILQLFEAARKREPIQQQEGGADDMDAADLKKLQESNATLAAEVRKLRERAAIADAAGAVNKYFAGVRVSEAIQQRISQRVLAGTIPLTESGDLDMAKLNTFVEAELNDELAYIKNLTGGRIVVGMGSAQAPQLTEAEKAEQTTLQEREIKAFNRTMGFGKGMEVGASIMDDPANFDYEYNARKDVA